MSIGDVAVSQNNPDLVWVGTGEVEQPPEHVVGRRRLQVHRRRQDVYEHGPRTTPAHQSHRHRSDATTTSCSSRRRAALGARRRSRHLQDDRRRQDVEAGAERRRRHRRQRSRHGADEPKILYASTYQRRRSACCMNGGGPGSGIWKSMDGGDTWTRLTGGFPSGPLGRIGARRLSQEGRTSCTRHRRAEAAAAARRRGGAAESRTTRRPAAAGGRRADAVATAVRWRHGRGRAGLYRSDDAGATWRKVNNDNPRPMYFSQVRVDPNDPDVVIYGRRRAAHDDRRRQDDRTPRRASTIHDDTTRSGSIRPTPNHVMIGNDGGVWRVVRPARRPGSSCRTCRSGCSIT